jgi:hypothetical protein
MMHIPGGTILAVRRGLYWHVGIADGRGHAISRTRGMGVIRESLDAFVRGGSLHVVPIDRPSFPPAEIVARAVERLGEVGYDWIDDNCEHFAGECVYGERRSRQVRIAGAIGTIAGVALNFVGPNWIAAGAVAALSLAAFSLTARPLQAVPMDGSAAIDPRPAPDAVS